MGIVYTTRMKTGIVITILLALGALILATSVLKPDSAKNVTDFTSCREAGYPILESFPEQCTTPDGRTFTNTDQVQPVPGVTGKEDLIVVNVPVPSQPITSGFIASGQARGGWYFEGSFPLTLVDADGKTLAQTYATAQGEWMTQEFVPFISQPITFAQPATATGTLIFHKDNASGLPEHDDELRVPVQFGATNQRSVQLYFYDDSKDLDAQGNVLCSSKGLVAVSRSIPSSATPIQDAVKALLGQGPTAAERTQGLESEFPLSGVTLQSANLTPAGTLTLAFADPQNRTSGGSCRVGILRAQIEATAKQFPEVKTVVLAPAAIFQP